MFESLARPLYKGEYATIKKFDEIIIRLISAFTLFVGQASYAACETELTLLFDIKYSSCLKMAKATECNNYWGQQARERRKEEVKNYASEIIKMNDTQLILKTKKDLEEMIQGQGHWSPSRFAGISRESEEGRLRELNVCEHNVWISAAEKRLENNNDGRTSDSKSQVTSNIINAPSEAQAISRNALNIAQQNTAQAETAAAKLGKRRHNPLAEAHNCLKPDVGGLYGGFTNSCPYKVHYEFCSYRAKQNSWGSMMDCESKQHIGAGSVGPNRQTTDLLNGAQIVYWFACKDPYWAVHGEFIPGKGIVARCSDPSQ